jgi:signal transduction histidine kinase
VQQADLRKIIKEVISELSPRSDRKGISITFHQRATSLRSNEEIELPTAIIDIDKVKEVLVNLIGNSLKFTPSQGRIAVSLVVDTDFIQVIVKDSGVGLNTEQIPLLFKKFSMLRESYSNNATMAQGTGLGLYICKSIIELHGGKIWVESEGKGKGSTFYFTVPRYSQARLKTLQKNQHNGTDAGIIHSAVADY